jgi:nucleoid DNA-binding protein
LTLQIAGGTLSPKTMTKQELIKRVASTAGLPTDLSLRTVGAVVDAVFAQLGQYFVTARPTRREAARFTYPGFGTFTKKRRGARGGRNPRTGEAITIPASNTVVFAPGVELRAQLNREAGGKK